MNIYIWVSIGRSSHWGNGLVFVIICGSLAERRRAYAIMNCLSSSRCRCCLWPVLLHTYYVQESSFFKCSGIIIQLYIHRSSFLHVLGISALKLVPLILACLKTSGCTEFGPLNTKERDVLAQNVFSQKQIIIQLWNLYHCNQHAWNPQGALTLAL